MRCPVFAAAAVVVLSIAPAHAKVLAEGAAVKGFYWQKIEASNGVRYLCRSQSDAKIQKHSKCENAGAVKPE
jgi:hypothetical protein